MREKRHKQTVVKWCFYNSVMFRKDKNSKIYSFGVVGSGADADRSIGTTVCNHKIALNKI